MKRTLIWLAAIGLLVSIGLLGYGAIRANRYLDAPLRAGGGIVAFEVPRGTTLDGLIDGLVDAGIVTDRLVFSLYARYQGLGADLKAGVHAVDLDGSPRALIAALGDDGRARDVEVTLPEGLNRWEIADRLAAAGLVEREAFLAQVEAEGLEGRLFPDTYRFHPKAGHRTVIERLTGRFDAVAAELAGPVEPAARARWLKLASLVEAEAKTERDRRLVARVFENRLAAGMKLQTDPTCVYGAERYQRKPSPALCKDPKNEYSTYVIDGLPPTPITNPGRAALAAALRPADEPGADALLYFVARGDGSGEHEFNSTYDAHRRAVDRYLRR